MSATQTYDRWFLTPAVTVERTDGNGNTRSETVPKYSDTDGITGYSGAIIPPSTIEKHYPGFVDKYPDLAGVYIVRMYGVGSAGWDAINTIHTQGDTLTLADHANDVIPVLKEHFPDLDMPDSEWANAFRVALDI